jgi:MoaA/NifB/PqqE/SkfB family radical SAM enzyme
MNIQDTMRKAELLVHENKLQEAKEQFLLVIQYDRENKEAYNNLGFIAFSEMENEKAISHFKKAIDIDPLYIDAILNLCDVMQSTNSLAEVRPIIEKAIKEYPDNEELVRMLKDMGSAIMVVKRIEDQERMNNACDEIKHHKKNSNPKKSMNHRVWTNDGYFKDLQHAVKTLFSSLSRNEAVDPLFAMLLLKETFKFDGARNVAILNTLMKIINDSGFLYEAYLLAKRSLEIQETDLARSIIDAIVRPPMPQRATIEVTTYCNLKCPLCSLQKRPEAFQKREHLKLDKFRFIWDQIKQSLKIIILVGDGESFLNPDIYDIIELTARDCPHVYVDTNGCLNMDHDRLVMSGLAELNFSIDGIDQKMYTQYRRKGRFDKAISNMKKALEAKKRLNRSTPKVVWKYVVFKHNEAYVKEAAKMAKEIGVDEFRLEPCTYDGADWDELVRFTAVNPEFHRGYFFSKKYSRVLINPNGLIKHCTIPLRDINILINGDVKFCCSLDRNQTIGNIMRADSFLDIWHSRQAVYLRKTILGNHFDFAPCMFCTMRQGHMESFLWDTEFAEEKDEVMLFDDLFPEEERIYYDDIRIGRNELEVLKAAGKEMEVAYFENLNRIQED